MMESKSITIQVKSKRKGTNKCKKLNLEDHVEVKKDGIKYFFGCWIKCINIKTMELFSGGFLTKIEGDSIYLRPVNTTEPFEININHYTLFVKQGNEQYNAYQHIEMEKERLKIMNEKLKRNTIELNKKIDKYEKDNTQFQTIRDKFYKLFETGKVKILV